MKNLPEGRTEALVKECTKVKAQHLVDAVWESRRQWPKNWIIAGGALNGEKCNDIDCFLVGDGCGWSPSPSALGKDAKVIIETKNAMTVKYKNQLIQFCRYVKPTLGELVESFDFSHCQIGAEVESNELQSEKYYVHKVKSVYCSQKYLEWKLTGKTEYLGSEFPLSSLLRVGKYWRCGLITSGGRMWLMLQILTDVVERGFTSYDDFKDQLDAVDLGLVPDASSDDKTLGTLFELLKK